MNDSYKRLVLFGPSEGSKSPLRLYTSSTILNCKVNNYNKPDCISIYYWRHIKHSFYFNLKLTLNVKGNSHHMETVECSNHLTSHWLGVNAHGAIRKMLQGRQGSSRDSHISCVSSVFFSWVHTLHRNKQTWKQLVLYFRGYETLPCAQTEIHLRCQHLKQLLKDMLLHRCNISIL